jgi:hypothetical protein
MGDILYNIYTTILYYIIIITHTLAWYTDIQLYIYTLGIKYLLFSGYVVQGKNIVKKTVLGFGPISRFNLHPEKEDR